MATTKSAGTSKNARDSRPKYLGVKLFAGQAALPGSILVRQRGTKVIPGNNVKEGSDNTLYSTVKGIVRFTTTRKRNFNNTQRRAKVVHVDN